MFQKLKKQLKMKRSKTNTYFNKIELADHYISNLKKLQKHLIKSDVEINFEFFGYDAFRNPKGVLTFCIGVVAEKGSDDSFDFCRKHLLPLSNKKRDIYSTAYDWLFSNYWQHTDKSKIGLVARIQMLLSFGLPKNYYILMTAQEQLNYKYHSDIDTIQFMVTQGIIHRLKVNNIIGDNYPFY